MDLEWVSWWALDWARELDLGWGQGLGQLLDLVLASWLGLDWDQGLAPVWDPG